jgi:hypothetical protein
LMRTVPSSSLPMIWPWLIWVEPSNSCMSGRSILWFRLEFLRCCLGQLHLSSCLMSTKTRFAAHSQRMLIRRPMHAPFGRCIYCRKLVGRISCAIQE